MRTTIQDLLSHTDDIPAALQPYLDWSPEQYVDHWSDVRLRGGHIPKLIDRYLIQAMRHIMESHHGKGGEYGMPAYLEELDRVDIEYLLFHFSDKNDSIAINRLRSGGVASIGQLMKLTYNELITIPYIGSTTMFRTLRYMQWIRGNQEVIVADHRGIHSPVVLPIEYTPEMSLLGALHKALSECAGVLAERHSDPRFARNQRDASAMSLLARLLKLRYDDHLSFAASGAELGRTPWHVTKTHADFVSDLCHGLPVLGNIELHPDVLHRIADVQQNALFRRVTVFGAVTPEDGTLINILGLDVIEVASGVRMVIPAREKCYYTGRTRALLRTLRESIVPLSVDEVMERVKYTKEFLTETRDGDREFVAGLLAQPEIVDTDDEGRVAIRTEHFISDEQRVARIIFEEGRWLTRNEIFARFEEKIGRPSNSVNLSNLRKYDIHSCGDLWIYGKKLEPINRFIAGWARRRRIFYMSELQEELDIAGYPILPRIRAYITNECLVDNLDSNHFCHKEFASLFDNFSWRRPGRTGLSNWILTHIKEALEGNGGRMSYDNLVDLISRQAREEGLETYIRQRVKSTLTLYSGPGQPFTWEGGEVSVNEDIIPTVNFATLGRRGHSKSGEFEQIRRLAIATIEESDEGKISLVEFLRLLSGHGMEGVSRNSCIRAIGSVHLPPIPIETANIDGAIYIQRKP